MLGQYREWGPVMYKKILVPVDTADPALAKHALAAACELARVSGGEIRLVNVLAMTPVMLAEYVPPDFDVQQRNTAEASLKEIGGSCKITSSPGTGTSASRSSGGRGPRRRLDSPACHSPSARPAPPR